MRFKYFESYMVIEQKFNYTYKSFYFKKQNDDLASDQQGWIKPVFCDRQSV